MPQPETKHDDTTVFRSDYVDFNFGTRETKFDETPEGFLIGRAVVTNVGVFPYRQADGSVRYELRPPEEVFKDTALASLRGKPLTNDHPTEAVTPENVKDLAVGSVGDGVSRDEMHVLAPITIVTKDAIAAVRGGKRALSCGYRSKLRTDRVTYPIKDYKDEVVGEKVYECPGVWMGVPYDGIQTDLAYNHVAIVHKGRAGDAAVLRLDGACQLSEDNHPPQKRENPMSTVKVRLDNDLEYDAAPEVAKAYTAVKADLDEALELLNVESEGHAATKADAEKKASGLQAELDVAKEKIKELEGKLETAKGDAVDPAKLDAAVKARQALLDIAAKAGVVDATKLDAAGIKKAVLTKVRPGLALDGKGQVYLDAAFDAVSLDVALVVDQTNQNRQDSSDLPTGDKGKPRVDSLADARQKYQDRVLGRAA